MHCMSDRKSPLAAPEKKKHKKAHKPKPIEVPAPPVEAATHEISEVGPPTSQPTEQLLQGVTPAEETAPAPSADPKPMAAMMDEQLFAKLEGTGESAAFNESVVTSPVWAPIPLQAPSPNRVPSPVRDPSPIRVPTPVKDSSPKQAPIPVADPHCCYPKYHSEQIAGSGYRRVTNKM
ncbi:hypothetical protein OROMI_020996 [Orobanche minor]